MPIIEDIVRTNLQLVGGTRYAAEWTRAARAAGVTADALDRLQDRALSTGVAVGAAGTVIIAGIRGIMREAGQLQQARIGFETMLGSAEASAQMITRLQDFARKTPFDFPETVEAARHLRAAGMETEMIFRSMTAVGDAMATLGGDTERFSMALDTLFRIQTRGRIYARDVFSLGAHGIPIKRILQEELGLSDEEIARIGELNISSDKAIGAIIRGLSKPPFAGGMERQAGTLVQSLSNLRDAVFQLASAMGEPWLRPISWAARALTSLVVLIKDTPGLAFLMSTALFAAAAGTVVFGVKTAIATYHVVRQVMAMRALEMQALRTGAAMAAAGLPGAGIWGGVSGGVAGGAGRGAAGAAGAGTGAGVAAAAAAGGGLRGWLAGAFGLRPGTGGVMSPAQKAFIDRMKQRAFDAAQAANAVANVAGGTAMSVGGTAVAADAFQKARAARLRAATGDVVAFQKALAEGKINPATGQPWTRREMASRFFTSRGMGVVGGVLGAGLLELGHAQVTGQGGTMGLIASVLSRGGQGALIGGMFGGVGGAIIGGSIGLIGGTIEEYFARYAPGARERQKPGETADQAIIRQQAEQIRLQEQELSEIRAIRRGDVNVLTGGGAASVAAAPGRMIRALAGEF